MRRERLEQLKCFQPTDSKVEGKPLPQIHFGRIASANFVMKSGCYRDAIAENKKILAFEMEGVRV